MRHGFVASYEHVRIRPLLQDDIELLRKWRNDASETAYLKPIGHVTEEMQQSWFKSVQDNPTEMTFAILETQRLKRVVGSLSLYDIEGDRAQIGKIRIGDREAHGRGIGRIALVMGLKIAFHELGLDTVWATVHQENTPARENDLRIGFRIVGQVPSVVGGTEDVIEITEQDAKERNPYYDHIEISAIQYAG